MKDLPRHNPNAKSPVSQPFRTLAQAEKQAVIVAFETFPTESIVSIAQRLGVCRAQMYRLIRKYGLDSYLSDENKALRKGCGQSPKIVSHLRKLRQKEREAKCL